MNRTSPHATIRRLAATLAALASALLTATAAAPAAFALPFPPAGGATQPPAPTVVAGGMPGWQIALIAIAAAVVAAAVAVLLDRARAARRHQPAPSA